MANVNFTRAGRKNPLHDTFLLSGPWFYFAPFFAPSRIENSKERNLDRKENFCGGEDVSDIGSKNREIHVSGILRQSEIDAFDEIVENSDKLDLVTGGWSGEVQVAAGDWEGPIAVDPQSGETLYNYSFDFVSTGYDEKDHKGIGNGIVSRGRN